MDINLFFKNPTKDCDQSSPIPLITKKQPCILGIDEAGRGPVLGPMVYAAAYYPSSKENQLKKMSFADSKTLTEKKREQIFSTIGTEECEELGWFAKILSPVTISNSMFKRSKYNLNELSHDTAIGLINKAIKEGVKVEKVFVDTVGPVDKYQAKLKGIFPSLKITVANKADSTYPIVSAASICAKVIRDNVLSSWNFIENISQLNQLEKGSGYPGDPSTKSFLENSIDPIFGFSSLVRFSWSTITKILNEKAIECEWEEEDDSKDNMSIVNMFKRANSSKTNTPKINWFFRERNLTHLTSLDSF